MIDGVHESGNESWAETATKVRKLLSDKLQISGIESERVHRRPGAQEDTTRSRPIVVKFLKFKDKIAVMERAKNLKGSNVLINEDYPEEVGQKRKELLTELKATRERGYVSFLRYDKLIVLPAFQRKDKDKPTDGPSSL